MLRRIQVNEESASADAARPAGACASGLHAYVVAKAKVAATTERHAVLRISEARCSGDWLNAVGTSRLGGPPGRDAVLFADRTMTAVQGSASGSVAAPSDHVARKTRAASSAALVQPEETA